MISFNTSAIRIKNPLHIFEGKKALSESSKFKESLTELFSSLLFIKSDRIKNLEHK